MLRGIRWEYLIHSIMLLSLNKSNAATATSTKYALTDDLEVDVLLFFLLAENVAADLPGVLAANA